MTILQLYRLNDFQRDKKYHEWLIHNDQKLINPLTPELNRSAQRCLTRFFTGDFAS
jgi:hypothetical protein